MKQCVFCRKDILPGQAAVSIVGGLMDPEEPDFFVADQDVLIESYAHREELLAKLQPPVA